MTDDRANPPTMGGSNEPPYLLPKQDRTGRTDRQNTLLRNHSGLRTSEPRRGPELASMVSNIPCPPTCDPKHRKPPYDLPEKSP